MKAVAILRQQAGEGRGRETVLANVTVIGRSEKADLSLDDNRASRQHAELRPDGETWLLVDLGSTNKTFHNGVPLPPHTPTRLKNGEIIRIGNTEFQFICAPSAAEAPSSVGSPTQTFSLKPLLTIGRDPKCDFVLDVPSVSWRHCQIVQKGAEFWLEDLESRNGTFLNGVRVLVPEPLANGAEIRIGLNVFIFRNNTLEHFDQNGTVRVDVSQLNHTVQKSGKPLRLLNNIHFTISPGEFVTIVGGSGAGKSTLLKALTGFRPASEGSVRLNGVEFYTHLELFRTAIGYVPQDDIVHQELTVGAVLRYAAQLRLPPDTGGEETERRIDETLRELELSHRKDAFVHTLSGGERKRVNVGVELLTRPSLLFLDEPTSGLDPGLESKFISLVKRLASEGLTIIMVTHSVPSIEQCDKLLFLARGGYVAFFGPPQEALDFFKVTDFQNAFNQVKDTLSPEEWEKKYRASPYYERYVREPLATAPKHQPGETMVVAKSLGVARPKASVSWQFNLLLRRYVDTFRGDIRNVALLLAQAPIIALLLLAVFPSNLFGEQTGVASAGFSGPKPSLLLFCMVVSAILFGIVNAAREITKERAIYSRERLANLHPLPYLLSKIAVLSALCVIQTVLLFGIVRLKIDFHLESGRLFGFLLTLLLATICGMLLGLTVSAFAKNNDQAMSLVPVAVLPQIIFSGLIEMESLGAVRNLMPSYWAYGALGNLTNLNAHMRFPNQLFNTSPEAAWVALSAIGTGYAFLSLWLLSRKDMR
jgi:ABC-type multidrug transport system ATPase subunit